MRHAWLLAAWLLAAWLLTVVVQRDVHVPDLAVALALVAQVVARGRTVQVADLCSGGGGRRVVSRSRPARGCVGRRPVSGGGPAAGVCVLSTIVCLGVAWLLLALLWSFAGLVSTSSWLVVRPLLLGIFLGSLEFSTFLEACTPSLGLGT